MHTKAVGLWLPLAMPNAKKLADLSSKTGIVFMVGCWARAMVKGVDLEPGQITAFSKPN